MRRICCCRAHRGWALAATTEAAVTAGLSMQQQQLGPALEYSILQTQAFRYIAGLSWLCRYHHIIRGCATAKQDYLSELLSVVLMQEERGRPACWAPGWRDRLPDQATRVIVAQQGAVNAVAFAEADEGPLLYCIGQTGTLKTYSLRTGLQVKHLLHAVPSCALSHLFHAWHLPM